RAAYDALAEETKRRLDRMVAEHSIFNSRARLGFTNFSDEERRGRPPVPPGGARTIPETRAKTPYPPAPAGRGLRLPQEDGRALIHQLTPPAADAQFATRHRRA